ncbi:MAG: PorV/PorQ family protein [Candidatus Cloacimonadaceae bacterium]|nr:PorV/PorQ family protein [Candidatus Cloacimonadaceae bacterium]
MKKIYLVSILLGIGLWLCAGVHDNAGSYGFKFLQNPTNPISLSLAGRGTGVYNNPAGFVHQPASQVHYRHSVVSASHTLWLADTKFTNVSYSLANRSSHFGIIMRNLDYGEVENRDDSGELIGFYSPVDMNLMANYALRLNPSSYFGVNAGILYEKLNTASAFGMNCDLGYTYLPPILDSRMSFAIRNLGFTSKMNRERIDLPVTLELELNKGFSFDNAKLSLGAFGIKADDEDVKGAFFGELEVSEIFAIRAGYKLNYAAEDITAGFGVKVLGIGIDYGWASYNSQLDDVHSLGISYSF